jgi:hypothetical protein
MLRRAIAMTIQKRQKELKRQEKQREKSEERRNKKIARRAEEHHGRAIADESTQTRSVTDVDGHDIENPT